MLRAESLDGVINLTPATLHGAGQPDNPRGRRRPLSEKPLASSLEEARRVDRPGDPGRRDPPRAPGSAATDRVRWLKDLAASGRLGKPTLAVAHHADPRPGRVARVHRRPDAVLPRGRRAVIDHGVYRLHEMTALLGPVQRVQAMGSIALPTRRVSRRADEGQHDRGDDAGPRPRPPRVRIGRARPASRQLRHARHAGAGPKLHRAGVVSFGGKSWELDAQCGLSPPRRTADSASGRTTQRSQPTRSAWSRRVPVTSLAASSEEEGPGPHRGARPPRPRRDLKAYASIEDGRAHATETDF